jgi:hypothetical protein
MTSGPVVRNSYIEARSALRSRISAIGALTSV